ncbi:MAG: ABC transporter ATP-binding protein [Phycisphaerales bacterium]|nr:ABC transporter ATP-binding protein [Phycisphaerales bacterium]
MIRCQDVTKAYHVADRTVQALRGVTMDIPGPGFFAIMGQSGSGKSTLLHLLAALDRPDSGELSIAGKPVHSMSDKDATRFRRREIGIVFQQFNLIPTLTARENVELPGMLAGENPKWLTERSAELLSDLGVIERSEHRPEALSGGEQQRVAIARALLYSPSVILADEPTGNLDSASAQLLWGLLGRIADQHETTVVMVTHEPAAAAHCRAIYVIRDGRMTSTIQTEGLDAGGVAARYQECLGAP